MFESPSHYDENDVQTISHKCEVLNYAEYQQRKKDLPVLLLDDPPIIYYYGGTYDPLSGKIGLATDVPLKDTTDASSSKKENDESDTLQKKMQTK